MGILPMKSRGIGILPMVHGLAALPLGHVAPLAPLGYTATLSCCVIPSYNRVYASDARHSIVAFRKRWIP